MKFILKPNDKDKSMIEIWNNEYNLLRGLMHVASFYPPLKTPSNKRFELYNKLLNGNIVEIEVVITKSMRKEKEEEEEEEEKEEEETKAMEVKIKEKDHKGKHRED